MHCLPLNRLSRTSGLGAPEQRRLTLDPGFIGAEVAGAPAAPPHLSGPRCPKTSFLWGGGSGVSQGAGQVGGAASLVGR